MTLSLATGAALDAATFADFIKRMRHDCVGAGVRDHCTAEAIFIVQCKRLVYGFDAQYAEHIVVICDEHEWFSPKEYFDDQDAEGRVRLHKAMQSWSSCGFMDADESDQWYVLGELEDHTVTGYTEQWEYINAHMTKDAAEAFIKRKKHDYRHGMRVYVDSQYYAWEYNQIKEALLSGALRYVDPATPVTLDQAIDMFEAVACQSTYDMRGGVQSVVELCAGKVVVGLQSEASVPKFKFDTLVDHCKRQDDTIAELRAHCNDLELYREQAVWHWQHDGQDFLKSLTCPVVIPAAQLREVFDLKPVPLPMFSGYQEHVVRELQAAFRNAAEGAGMTIVEPVPEVQKP